jgi:hypothetical protein
MPLGDSRSKSLKLDQPNDDFRVEEEVEFWEWTLFCRCYRRRRSGLCLFVRLPLLLLLWTVVLVAVPGS